jgi:hypothetical protein
MRKIIKIIFNHDNKSDPWLQSVSILTFNLRSQLAMSDFCLFHLNPTQKIIQKNGRIIRKVNFLKKNS